MDGCSLLPCLHRASSFGICSLTTLRLESVKGIRWFAVCQRLEKSLPATSRGHPFRGSAGAHLIPGGEGASLSSVMRRSSSTICWRRQVRFCSWLSLQASFALASPCFPGGLTPQGVLRIVPSVICNLLLDFFVGYTSYSHRRIPCFGLTTALMVVRGTKTCPSLARTFPYFTAPSGKRRRFRKRLDPSFISPKSGL